VCRVERREGDWGGRSRQDIVGGTTTEAQGKHDNHEINKITNGCSNGGMYGGEGQVWKEVTTQGHGSNPNLGSRRKKETTGNMERLVREMRCSVVKPVAILREGNIAMHNQMTSQTNCNAVGHECTLKRFVIKQALK